MKIAIPIWNNRVSPVLDTAGQLLLVEVEGGAVVSRQVQALPNLHPVQRARLICNAGIDTLICGAVSQCVEATLANAGIRVVPFVGGDVEQVIQAYLADRLEQDAFCLPGCRRRRGRGGRGGAGRGRGGRGGGRGGRW